MEKDPTSVYKIRFSDCDPFGHLNNARYIDYFLNAREDHLKDAYNLDLSQYYTEGLGWLVGGHEINYLKPASYNEEVCIRTSLLKAADGFLLVEMVMTDARQTHVKSALWTRFIPVNIQTGKRENHPESFMEFAISIEKSGIDALDAKTRLAEILDGIKKTAVS